MCRFSFWIVTIFFITLALFIKPLISILYGDDFLPAADIFYYLYPSITFYIQGLYLNSAIAARGLNKETFTIRLKSLPVIILAAYLLITNYDIKGAAIAVSFSFTVTWLQYALKYFKISGSGFRNILILNFEDLLLVTSLFRRINPDPIK